MAKIKSAKEVRYLAFEGGGGKGIAFVGAIEALEELEVLPVCIKDHDESRIKGISGASAGAITALGVAMGMTAKDFSSVVKDGVTYKGKTVTLADFLDAPMLGQSRKVDNCRPNTEVMNLGDLIAFLGKIGLSYKLVMKYANDFKGAVVGMLPLLLGPVAGTAAGIAGNKTLQRLLPTLDLYIVNFIFEKGLFPGFAVREFFGMLVNKYLVEPLREKHPEIPDGSVMSFSQFYAYTGVDFVVAGTNVSTHEPAYFSAEKTPDFPVVEAVAISMNIPFLFKPVKIDGRVTGSEEKDKKYRGLWMDGGTLNNLPLHAFDKASDLVCQGDALLKPLHPNMLALRLSPPKKGTSDAKACQGGGLPILGLLFEKYYSFFDFAGDLYETMMYYSEEGQLRTELERQQTIEINTYCLSMTEFSPPEEVTKKPIAAAKKGVQDYFAQQLGDFPASDDDGTATV